MLRFAMHPTIQSLGEYRSRMLSEKYKQSLTSYEGKRGAFLYGITLLAPFFLLAMGGLNIWFALRISSTGDFTLVDIIRVWFDEIDMQGEYRYSGIFLAGLQRLNTAIIQFSFAVALFPMALGVRFHRKRDRAILDALRKHGEI